jgi:hypothetical protein
VLVVIVLYILFRMTVYIVQTFIRYKAVAAKPLWYSFGVFVLLTVLGSGIALLVNNQAPLGLEGIGFGQLFLTCVVVRRQYANTFMTEGVSMKNAILHQKWWQDADIAVAA